MPEPTPSSPETQEPLTELQQVLVNSFREQLNALRQSLVSNRTDPEQARALYDEARDKANSLLRKQGINEVLT